MNIILAKTLSGLLPVDPPSEEWYRKLKTGDHFHADFKKFRNVKFHRKYFALLKIGFDNWEPGEISSRHGVPLKNFERFRKDIAIMCGHFHLVIRLDKTSRIEADSISFADMNEDTFSDLYSKTIDVLIKNVYGSEMTPEKLDEIVNKYLNFA